jgi:hypothetical protein
MADTVRHLDSRVRRNDVRDEMVSILNFGARKTSMSIKFLVFALSAVLLAFRVPTEAQQPTKVPRIGYLAAGALSAQSARIEAFQRGLRELGYVEGKNIVIEWRSGEEKLDRLPALAAELASASQWSISSSRLARQ